MNIRRISGIVLMVVGVGLFLFGNYVAGEVDQGRKKISSAQQKVDFGKKATDLSPYTKDIGNLAAKPIQKKIDEGKDEADQYQTLARWTHISAIAVFALGILLFIFSFIHRKKA